MAKAGLTSGKMAGTDGAELITVRVPLAEPQPRTYIAEEDGRVDVQLGYGGPDTRAFRRLHAGLIASQATLSTGRPVVTKADVIRWLFQQISDQAEN